jgi:hypothetical protein
LDQKITKDLLFINIIARTILISFIDKEFYIMAANTAFLEFFADKTESNPLKGAMINLKGNIEEDMELMGLPMTQEGIAMIAMTYVASTTPGSTITKSFADIASLRVTAKFMKNYTAEMTSDVPPVPVRGPDHANGEAPTYFSARKTSEEFGDYGAGNISLCPDVDLRALYSGVVGGYTDWKTFFIDLLGSSQVKELTPGHVASYFAWKKSPGVLGELIASKFSSITGGMPEVVTVEALRNLMTEGEWKVYRLTFAASGGLITKMVQECPTEYLTVFSPETIAAVNDYAANKWEQAKYRVISKKALGIMYAYLKATDQLTDGLQGPKRAYEELSAPEKISLHNWFTEAKGKFVVYGGKLMGNKSLPKSITGV